MKEVGTSETSVSFYQNTEFKISEERYVHVCHYQNL
jgi:hypothetical protein